VVQVSSSEGPTDVPLGIFEATRYGQVGVKLGAEDLLLCFTDGLEECVDERGEMRREGMLRLLTEVDHRAAQELIPELLRRVTAMSEANLSEDDDTIMLMRPNGASVSLRDNLLAPFRDLSDLVGLTP